MIEELTKAEVQALDAGNCPDCGDHQFLEGPHGGMSVNIECATCGARFNVVPGLQGSFGKERIGPPTKPIARVREAKSMPDGTFATGRPQKFVVHPSALAEALAARLDVPLPKGLVMDINRDAEQLKTVMIRLMLQTALPKLEQLVIEQTQTVIDTQTMMVRSQLKDDAPAWMKAMWAVVLKTNGYEDKPCQEEQ